MRQLFCSTNVKDIDFEELLQLFNRAGLAFDKCIASGKASDDGQSAGTNMSICQWGAGIV